MKTYKGLYKVKNPEKYKGDPKKVIYRSSWEHKYMRELDRNPNVIAWASEEIAIPYFSKFDQKMHRYYPDFWVKVKTKTGKIKQMIIEIKPFVQTKLPKKKRVTKRLVHEAFTYEINQAKWQAAQAFCDKYGLEFKVLTEKDLGLNK